MGQAVGAVAALAIGAGLSPIPIITEDPELPTWMRSIERFGPLKTFGLALVLSANPKNLALAGAAAASLAQLDPSTAEAAAGLATFVLVGSAAVTICLVFSLVGGDRAQATLEDAKAWFTHHSGAVMMVLFLVFGAVLLARGLTLRT